MSHTFSPLPLSVENARFAISYNYERLRERLRSGMFGGCQEYWWLDGNIIVPPGKTFVSINRKTDDLVASVLIGALPYVDGHGDDALIWNDQTGEFSPVEVKLSFKSKYSFIRTSNNALLLGNKVCYDSKGCVSNRGFKQAINANYEIVNNLNSKNVTTYLVVMDEYLLRPATILKMTGEQVLERLSTNSHTGAVRTSRKRTISLSAFEQYGEEVFPEHVHDIIGLTFWEEYLKNSLQRPLIPEIQRGTLYYVA